MSTKKDKAHQDLVKGLQATEEKTVLEAINKSKSLGTPKLIPDLFNLWFKSTGEINTALTELLYTLKDKETIPAIFEELEKTTDTEKREKIISVIWNAGLEPKAYLSRLVEMALKGEFMEAVECLTVIENMEPPFDESQLMDSLLMLKEYFSKNPEGEKVTIIRSIATFIQYTEGTQVDI